MDETHLVVRKISPWATLRVTAAVAAVGFLAWMVAIGILYIALEGMGFWSQFSELIGGEGSVSAGLVMLVAAAVGALWMILTVGLASLGAVVYNACSDLVGGIKVSLADD